MTILTPKNKKLIASGGLLLSGWYTVASANVINLPALPSILTVPLAGKVTVLFIGGVVTILTLAMLWTDY